MNRPWERIEPGLVIDTDGIRSQDLDDYIECERKLNRTQLNLVRRMVLIEIRELTLCLDTLRVLTGGDDSPVDTEVERVRLWKLTRFKDGLDTYLVRSSPELRADLQRLAQELNGCRTED